jgi:hypothetical protein
VAPPVGVRCGAAALRISPAREEAPMKAMDELAPARVRAVAGLMGARPPEGPVVWVGSEAPVGPAALALAWPGPGSLSPDARRGWWAALAAALVPGGVAVVRVDVLPGWHAVTAVQDFARFHASRRGVSLAAALDEVTALPRGDDDGGRWEGWIEVVAATRAREPEALPGLELGSVHAAELHAWVAEAAAAGLAWLGDLRGPVGARWTLAPPLRAWVDEEVSLSDDPVRGAQIADLAQCRHTRRLLLVRGAPTGDGPRDLHLGPPDVGLPGDAFDPTAEAWERHASLAAQSAAWGPCADLALARELWTLGAATLREG